MADSHVSGQQETVFGVKLSTVVTITLAIISIAISLLGIYTRGISNDMKEMAKTVGQHSEEIVAIKTQGIADRTEMCDLKAEVWTVKDRQLQILVHFGIKPNPPIQPNYDSIKTLNGSNKSGYIKK